MTTSSASLILPSATWSSPSWGSEWRDPSPQWSYQPSRSRREWMICGLKDLIKKSGPAGPSPSCRRQACQIPWCLCVSIYLESIQCVVIYINKIVREWNNQSLISHFLSPPRPSSPLPVSAEHIPGSVWHSRPTLLCRSDSQISFGENNGLIYKGLLEVPVVEKIFWTGV